MGLSNGEHRTVPEFNQSDLKDAIIKGFYGEAGYTGMTMPGVGLSSPVPFSHDLLGLARPSPRHGVSLISQDDGRVRKVVCAR